MTVQSQFAAFLETWTKGAVEKISMILKVSTCEVEGSPAAEQRAGLVDRKKQCSVTQKESRVSVRKNRELENYSSGSDIAIFCILNMIAYFCGCNYRSGGEKLSSEDREQQKRERPST